MFIGYQKDKIVCAANTRETLENMPCMQLDRIEETTEEYVLYDGAYIPQPLAQEQRKQTQKKAQINLLQTELDTLDLKAIRALRAFSAGNATEEDRMTLDKLEQQAAQIRRQIKELL